MPGLSQLKEFAADLRALGKETELLASRGEKPVNIPFPKSIKDIDDSEDFMMGMPEVSEDEMQAVEATQTPDDFSDITGDEKKSESAGENASETSAPDFSDLLNVVVPSADMPDMSAFMDEESEEETQEEVAEEPKETSIADMGLDALLGGSFDEEPEEPAPVEEEKTEKPKKNASDFEDDILHAIPKAKTETPPSPFDIPDIDALLNPKKNDTVNETPVETSSETQTQKTPATNASTKNDFDLPENFDISDVSENAPDDFTIPEVNENNFSENETSAKTSSETQTQETPATNASAKNDFDFSDEAIDMNVDSLSESGSDKGALGNDDFVEYTNADENPSQDFSQTENALDDFANLDLNENALDDFANLDLNENALDEFPKAEKNETKVFGNESANATQKSSENTEPTGTRLSLEERMRDDDEVPSENEVAPEVSEVLEKFDTTEMEGLDFTETTVPSPMSDDDFAIPGFSDTDEIKTDKSGRPKLDAPDFSNASESEVPTKNSLTEKQYKKFRANLTQYPLNVRIALEKLLVENEFTDDAQFEIVQKVLNKVPARQLAGSLEKMLDISIPVPRDFERRSASEYDAYKASFQYQLRNRIIPGILLTAISAVVLFGLFLFGKNVVYKPLKASSIYKQGFVLLQLDEFQQSEIKFNEATHWQIQKKWLFRYARSYRDKKQFQRAEKMYRNILYYFNFDKNAGIEYARMECDDLGNYEKAEEIAKRAVLDYHVNDIDGILLLGDIYLEWATEKDPTKFEDARKQYATLLELSPKKENELYYARMMRYFVRTDNLHEVLEMKQKFYPKSKGLDASDWTELGGYLFDKLYGTLPADQEYLRESIDDVRPILDKAVSANSKNPVAFYNLSKYFVQLNKKQEALRTLEKTISLFDEVPVLKTRDMYKAIDSRRLLGEVYLSQKEFLKAQESYVNGIEIFENEKESSGFAGNEQIGKLYADIADLDYFIRGDYESAYEEYKTATETKFDTPSIRYRMGFIEYANEDYLSAVNSFIESAKEKPNDNHMLFAMGNALLLRGDALASQSYYERLVSNLDTEKIEREIRQLDSDEAEQNLLGFYVKAENNLGVALYQAAKRRASSQLHANALVSLSTSMRAWDALTRNKETMVRLGGSNLAEQNMKYMSHPTPEYEPAIYSDIPKTLSGEAILSE